jgi:hypothetical protein
MVQYNNGPDHCGSIADLATMNWNAVAAAFATKRPGPGGAAVEAGHR